MSDQAQPTQMTASASSPQEMEDIASPHDNDVLSGRGNFVNYHPGNEHFRQLVKKYKAAYVACPKPEKAKFSRLIVDEIRRRNPPGRFLKQDNKTKLWYDIGDKKALDKTRQALREGAPELLKELHPRDQENEHPSVQKEAYDISLGVARLNTDDTVQYGSAGMHGIGVQSDTHASSSRMYNSDVHRMPVSISHSGTAATATRMPMPVHVGSNMQQQPSIPNAHSHQQASTRMSMPVHVGSNMQQQPSIPNAHLHQQASMNVAAATQNLHDLQKQLTTSYPVDQFEPTPINPNLAMQIQEAQAQLNALEQKLQVQGQKLQQQQQRRQTAPPELARDDSLKFQELFPEHKKEKVTPKATKEPHNNSSGLSQMSFSVGGMSVSEESNLSAVFEDSVRISDAPKQKEVKSESKSLPSSEGKPPSSKSLGLGMDSFDMSAMTFTPGESQANLGSSFGNPLQMSFSRVFDESSGDVNKKLG